MNLVLTHAANIPSNKYQHLLLFIALKNAPSTSLKLCANFSNKFQHLWLYFSLRNMPSSASNSTISSNKYQHLLLYLSLENVLKVCLGNNALKCLSRQYGPTLMVACCLGFRALDSSRNRALHQEWSLSHSSSPTSLSSLQAAPWNSSPLKLLLGIRASHQKISSWIIVPKWSLSTFIYPTRVILMTFHLQWTRLDLGQEIYGWDLISLT